jgi:hypothetical protein
VYRKRRQKCLHFGTSLSSRGGVKGGMSKDGVGLGIALNSHAWEMVDVGVG